MSSRACDAHRHPSEPVLSLNLLLTVICSPATTPNYADDKHVLQTTRASGVIEMLTTKLWTLLMELEQRLVITSVYLEQKASLKATESYFPLWEVYANTGVEVA